MSSDHHGFYQIHGQYIDSYFRPEAIEGMAAEAGLRVVTRRLGFWRGEQHKMAGLPVNWQDLYILIKDG